MHRALDTSRQHHRPVCCSAIRVSGTDIEVTAYRVGDDLVVVINGAHGTLIARVVLRDFMLHAARDARIGDIVLVPEPAFPAADQP